MTSLLSDEAFYIGQNGVLHHLMSLITSAGDDIFLVNVSGLMYNDQLSEERRHELADEVTQKFTLPQNNHPYTVVYVPKLEAFLAVDLNALR